MTSLAVEFRPSVQGADDLELVSGVRAGDDRAFEILYARYQPRIALYVRGMVQDHGRAEDITQEVFLSALRRIRDTDCQIVVKPWLYEIAKNACIDAFRRSRHTNEVSFDATDELRPDEHGRLADVHATPDHAVDTKLDLDNLCGAFGGLSDTHHQILVMRELEGLSYRDIGERMGMSRPAVESTLFRARRRLEEEYGELVSGKRCVRVRAIIDAGGRAPGVRDQRRLDRHISHCQPCRRHALRAGMDLEARPARPSVAARIAALLPLPALWRRPEAEDAPAQVLASNGHASVAHWSANVASTVDPATIGGWGKAVFTAATVALAGMGAGAAISERDKVREFFSHPPVLGGGTDSSSGEPGERGGARGSGGAGGSADRRNRAASSESSARGKTVRGGNIETHAPTTSTATNSPARPIRTGGPGRPPKTAPGPGEPGSGHAGPRPTGPQGGGGAPAAGGAAGDLGGLLHQTLGQTGSGEAPGETVGGGVVPSVVDGVAGALSTVTGAVTAPTQGAAASVTSALDATLGGN